MNEPGRDAVPDSLEASVTDLSSAARGIPRLLFGKVLLLVALALVGAAAARLPGVREWFSPEGQLNRQLHALGWMGYPVFVGSAAMLITVGVPRLLFCPIAGAAFGFWGGLAASTVATMAAYLISFRWIRGRMGRRPERWEPPPRLAFLRQDPGVGGVVLARLLPVPGLLGTLALALSPVAWSAYGWGSLIGLIPEAVPLILLGAGLFEGNPKRWAWLGAGALGLLVLCGWLIGRLLRKARQRG